MRPSAFQAVFALSLALGGAPTLWAQGSRASVSVTYVRLHDPDGLGSSTKGASLGAAFRIRDWAFVSGELAMSGNVLDAVLGGTYDEWCETLQAGPRVSPLHGRLAPYFEVLAGATRLGSWRRGRERTGDWGRWKLCVQPAVGIDVFIARRWALRLGGDFRRTYHRGYARAHPTQLYELRAGLAFHLGR